MKKLTWLLFAAMALTGLAAPSAQAQRRQEEFFQRSMFFERDIRERLEAVTPTDQKALIEYGGFYSPSYTYFTDLGGKHGHQTLQDLRLWTRIQVDQVHTVFARLRMDYIDFAAGDSNGFRGHDLQGPNLDVGYYELNLTGAMDKYFHQKWPVQAAVRGGRQYIEVGRGIAMGQILDAGLFTVETKDFYFKGFAGRSISSQDNIDTAAPDFTHSRRMFYGGEARYLGIEHHEPYALFVFQDDQTRERPNVPGQDFRYDSQYYGVGSRGDVVQNLRYGVESLWQFGQSAPFPSVSEDERIRAYAFDAELAYYIQHALKPVVSMEYGYASGDGDRASATTTILGNTPGTNDNQFQGFGYVNSGLALGARFSNLQFLRLGTRMTPYDNKAGWGRIDVGGDYYFLFKADKDGPISDFRANKTSGDVGQEIDIYLEWRILSDLAWSIRYGHFFPGQAYANRDGRDFLFTGFNFSF